MIEKLNLLNKRIILKTRTIRKTINETIEKKGYIVFERRQYGE